MIFITLPRVVHGSVSLGRLDSIFHVKTYQLTYRFRFLDILTRCRPLPESSWMVSSLGLGGLGGCRSDLDTSLPPIVAIRERKKKCPFTGSFIPKPNPIRDLSIYLTIIPSCLSPFKSRNVSFG